MGRVRAALYGEDGRPLDLGDRIGKGGEGEVFEVAGHTDRVAKIYNSAPGPEQEEKLLAMARLRTDRLLKLTAWPVGVLRLGRHGPVRGLLMPRVEGRPIHLLYSPKSRHANFPEASWAFLIAAAANVARSMAVVHEHGHVVADVNQGNILVSARATVALIDCDSFQVRDGERVFLCNVGVGPYVPPELQGGSLRVLRTSNHDGFGLAVLIFQLLFLGRHPFSGRFLGAGDLPLEKAIRELRFAYGAAAASHQMRPPPATPPLAFASPPVAALFEQAFSAAGIRDSGRPAAADWIGPLTHLGGELRACRINPAHEYWRGLPACPWCPLEAVSRTSFFDLLRLRPWGAGALDLQLLWQRIVSLPPPARAGQPLTAVFLPRPSLKARLQLLSTLLGLLPLVVFLGIAKEVHGAMPWLGWFGVGAFLLAALALAYWTVSSRQAVVRVDKAREHLRALSARWKVETSIRPFSDRLRGLGRRRHEYLELTHLRQQRLDELKFHPSVPQLRAFLRQFPIERPRLAGLDDSRRATLRSYGIETAADVESAALSRVPGLPAQLCIDLLAWKHALERRFRFVPTGGSQAEIAEVEHQMEQLRHDLEAELLRGPADLRRERQHVEQAQHWLRGRIEEAARELAQAEADRNHNRLRLR
jgi:DNA-binding helix-hairpin-helix protein with protein kinase domain